MNILSNAPGVIGGVHRDTVPLLFAFCNGVVYDLYRNDYREAVRPDGQCTSEVILMMSDANGGFSGAEGYEDLAQALKVLQALPGQTVHLSIFGDAVERVGKGVSDAYIITYNTAPDM